MEGVERATTTALMVTSVGAHAGWLAALHCQHGNLVDGTPLVEDPTTASPDAMRAGGTAPTSPPPPCSRCPGSPFFLFPDGARCLFPRRPGERGELQAHGGSSVQTSDRQMDGPTAQATYPPSTTIPIFRFPSRRGRVGCFFALGLEPSRPSKNGPRFPAWPARRGGAGFIGLGLLLLPIPALSCSMQWRSRPGRTTTFLADNRAAHAHRCPSFSRFPHRSHMRGPQK